MKLRTYAFGDFFKPFFEPAFCFISDSGTIFTNSTYEMLFKILVYFVSEYILINLKKIYFFGVFGLRRVGEIRPNNSAISGNL